MWRAVLLSAAACAGLAAATSLAVDTLELDQTQGPVARRYCSCHDKGQRYNMTYQTCLIRKDSTGELVCKNEMLPYVDRWYLYSSGIRGIYNVFNNRMRFYDAGKVCDEECARLAVPLNKDGFKDLYTTMKNRGSNSALLGISDRRVEGTFVDPDGLPPPYLPWGASNLPDNLHNKDCVRVYGPNHIMDVPCYYDQHPFVCERIMGIEIPKGYHYRWSEQRFYKFYRDRMTHAAARRRCEQDHGTLAAFESWPAAQVIRQIVDRYLKDYVWVDYTDEEVEGQFVTSTGMLLEDTDFINWYPEQAHSNFDEPFTKQPDNGGSSGRPENCVAIRATGEYFDEECGKQYPFLCQIKMF